MQGRYLLVLRDGLEERFVVRAFMDKIHPGSTIQVEVSVGWSYAFTSGRRCFLRLWPFLRSSLFR
jgi:hypothetical protein